MMTVSAAETRHVNDALACAAAGGPTLQVSPTLAPVSVCPAESLQVIVAVAKSIVYADGRMRVTLFDEDAMMLSEPSAGPTYSGTLSTRALRFEAFVSADHRSNAPLRFCARTAPPTNSETKPAMNAIFFMESPVGRDEGGVPHPRLSRLRRAEFQAQHTRLVLDHGLAEVLVADGPTLGERVVLGRGRRAEQHLGVVEADPRERALAHDEGRVHERDGVRDVLRGLTRRSAGHGSDGGSRTGRDVRRDEAEARIRRGSRGLVEVHVVDVPGSRRHREGARLVVARGSRRGRVDDADRLFEPALQVLAGDLPRVGGRRGQRTTTVNGSHREAGENHVAPRGHRSRDVAEP